ncbi:MAG: nitroreductase family protein [Coriobacteriia bacterium]|nr:nitroreductase family protein [Coriobacteriia bacterium]
MDVMEAIRGRHSYRSFRETEVPREVLDLLVEAAALAPSSLNIQPVRLIVATGETRRALGRVISLTTVHLAEYVEVLGPELYEKAVEFYGDLGASPVAVAVTLPKASGELQRINELLAAGTAVENMLLVATREGLGACNLTVSFWVRDELAELLRLPEDREVVSVIVLGYPDEVPHAPEHRLDIATFLE